MNSVEKFGNSRPYLNFLHLLLRLSIFLPKFLQAGLLEVSRRHGDLEFYVGFESKKPWLGKCRNLGRISQIYDQYCTALPVLFSEINGLRFGILQYAANLLAHGAVPDRLVELIMRKLNI